MSKALVDFKDFLRGFADEGLLHVSEADCRLHGARVGEALRGLTPSQAAAVLAGLLSEILERLD